MQIKGQIIKSHSNRYFISCGNEVVTASCRGVFKYRKAQPLVGDFVEVDGDVITKIYERKNCFLRPSVANVDCVNIVVSPEPTPDYMLIDKLVSIAEKNGCEIFITVNKLDLTSMLYSDIVKNYAKAVDEIIAVSADNGEGIERLISILKNKLTVFCGQSAVGKTSVINACFGLNRTVGEVSERILRGKNTTTYSEILTLNGASVIDTPGFSALDAIIKADELKRTYREFEEVFSGCYYADCKHINEPNCAVKNAVEGLDISPQRYARYIQLYNELKQGEKNDKH